MNGSASAPDPSRLDEGALRRAAATVRHPLAWALLLLTFTTGLVDAVSYLGLGRVFTANMTGNVVLLGFGLANIQGLPVLAPIISLAAFVFGAAAGGALAKAYPDRQPVHVAIALIIEASLTAGCAIVAGIVAVQPGRVTGYVLIAALALAMGVRNATVRRIGVADLTTTVLTMTLTALAADSRLFGGSGAGSPRRSSAVIAMLAGALIGALLLKTSLVAPLLGAAGLALVTWLVYRRAAGIRVFSP